MYANKQSEQIIKWYPSALYVESIYRYPVKGLTPELVEKVTVVTGEVLPGDRQFAFARSPGLFDPSSPAYLSKTNFLMLQRNERLAALGTSFNPETKMLTLIFGGVSLESDLSTKSGRKAAEDFMGNYLALDADSWPHIVSSPGHSFSDLDSKVISFVNLKSVQNLSRMLGKDLNPMRFRANIYFTGLEAWFELDWVGKFIKIGSARFEVVKRTQRCAAVNVNLETAKRDLNLPRTLIKKYGHSNLGVYARVTVGGKIKPGDEIEVLT